jgi:hypothetical protein
MCYAVRCTLKKYLSGKKHLSITTPIQNFLLFGILLLSCCSTCCAWRTKIVWHLLCNAITIFVPFLYVRWTILAYRLSAPLFGNFIYLTRECTKILVKLILKHLVTDWGWFTRRTSSSNRCCCLQFLLPASSESNLVEIWLAGLQR